MRRHIHTSIGTLILALLLLMAMPGCILIHTTEHQITLNDDGSGEALLRLIDLRSDATVDSLVGNDFKQLVQAYNTSGTAEFEKQGRKILGKQMVVHGDTLILEISYAFPKTESVEGLRRTKDHMYIVVGGGREVVKTNGSVEAKKDGTHEISWNINARNIMYVVHEKALPPSTSLARWFQTYHH